LEGGTPLEMLARFSPFPQIQVIDLDAALGKNQSKGSNDGLVELIASRAIARVGGGVRSAERARALIEHGAYRVIVGTAAFDREKLSGIADAAGPDRLIIALDSRAGKVVTHGWQQATNFTAEEMVHHLEPFCSGFLCTYVDKEGMLEGTDLDWFRRLRAATSHELTAAGGITTMQEIQELQKLGIHAALGMAIYTSRLSLDELGRLNS
jgi:phosphoribosylformimino-5-aminoimidazole carboxamide ribonucleotide (ProFAR) isomerase